MNYPELSIQHSEHSESLKARVFVYILIQLDCSVLETFYIVTVLIQRLQKLVEEEHLYL